MQAFSVRHTLENNLPPDTDGELDRLFFQDLCETKNGDVQRQGTAQEVNVINAVGMRGSFIWRPDLA